MVSYIAILVIVIVLCGAAAYYYFFMSNTSKKMVALYSNAELLLVMPELLKTNLTVTATPSLEGATIRNIIGTPLISITGLSTNTLYTFSVSGYDKSNPIHTGLPPPPPTPSTTPLPEPVLTLTKTDTSVTMSVSNIRNATSYQFLMMPYFNSQELNFIPPNPFTYKVSTQTNTNVTFTNITPYKYFCITHGSTSSWTSNFLSKTISIPLLINRPVIAILDINNYNQVFLYFMKDTDRAYTTSLVTAIPSLPNTTGILDSFVDNGLKISQVNINTLYQFSVNGITGSSNSLYTGQGTLGFAPLTPLITKVSATSFTVSINPLTGASSYQFVIYNYSNNLGGYLYAAASQTTSSMTFSNVPYGTYRATLQACNSTGTKVGISGDITIPLP